MSKKILLLEPSETIKTLIAQHLDGDCTLLSEADGRRFLYLVFTEKDVGAIWINAKTTNPKAMETMRLIKSLKRMKGVPIALYATSSISFEHFFTENAGAEIFVHLNEANIAQGVAELCSIVGKPATKGAIQNDVVKNALVRSLFSLSKDLHSLDTLVSKSLSLIASVTSSPAASLFILDESEAKEFYICSPNFSADETRDFLSVCAADFENAHPDTNTAKITPVRLQSKAALSDFHTKTVPLSSYEHIALSGEKGDFAMLHLVKEGNFSAEQQNLILFFARNVSVLLENAVRLKRQQLFEKNIRKAFSRFVPEQIIDELVKEADTSGKVAIGEKRKVAILFSDIRSFTSISEKNKPEVMVAFLNRYFTIMVNVIKKHGGTIDKFIGDAIMALFGAPVSYEDNARRAVAAASEMREALSTVPLGDLVLPEGMAFNIGIGIHYGDVTVGSIGSADKTDYTVIGDSVNLASRLEGLTKVYGSLILVSDSVKNDIKTDEFTFRHLDNVKVKGKAQAVQIFGVDKDADDFSPAYRDAYKKGMDLYAQGIFKLAHEYFEKALAESPADKATKLMLARCEEFSETPPDAWDGAIAFTTK